MDASYCTAGILSRGIGDCGADVVVCSCRAIAGAYPNGIDNGSCPHCCWFLGGVLFRGADALDAVGGISVGERRRLGRQF